MLLEGGECRTHRTWVFSLKTVEATDEKIGLQQQWASFPGRQDLFVQKAFLLSLLATGWPCLSSLPVKKGTRKTEKRQKLLFCFYSGLLLPCQTVNLFLFYKMGSS